MTEDSKDILRPYLLPNEDTEHICRIHNGFIVLSNRRFILMSAGKRDSYRIETSIPCSCLLNFEQKKSDRFEISGAVLDQNGQHTGKTKCLVIREPRDGREKFQSEMNQCLEIIEGIGSPDSSSAGIDYSYLEQLPESPTKNALL
ncbi:MAG: hypothetical protein ACFFEV_05030, partial [Candidatus Thorarchaeota archaeon]